MNKKPKLVIFEGVDEVGKTTVYQAFRKLTSYGPLCIDRFLASNFAYDMFWGREHHIKDYLGLEKSLIKNMDCILVYLTCESDTLNNRLIKAKADFSSKAISRIEEVDALFFFYFDFSSFRKIIVDTTHRSIDETAAIILQFSKADFEESRSFVSNVWRNNIIRVRMGMGMEIFLDGIETLKEQNEEE